MHKIFGEKENIEYYTRKGAYLIAVNDGKIAVVKTEKGLFLPGGGTEENETDEETIKRECLEEIGYNCEIEKLICTAEAYQKHPSIGPFHPVQKYYIGKLTDCVEIKTQEDHHLIWYDYEQLKGKLFATMQNWAVDRSIEQNNK